MPPKQRIDQLEADIKTLAAKLTAVENDLAAVKIQLANLSVKPPIAIVVDQPTLVPPVPPPAQPPQLDKYAERALYLHNVCREEHGVQPVAWDAKLAEVARKAAEFMDKQKVFIHSGQPNGPPAHGFGENISGGTTNIDIAIAMWVDERNKIPNDVVDGKAMYQLAGHFTQVCWKNTKFIGCATVGTKTVCVYSPRGNMMGPKFMECVPKYKDTDGWSSPPLLINSR